MRVILIAHRAEQDAGNGTLGHFSDISDVFLFFFLDILALGRRRGAALGSKDSTRFREKS